MKNDILFQIFITQLKETSKITETANEFIQNVSRLYAFHLSKTASVPLHYLSDVIHDIEAEVVEMYRKKTYGSLSLEEYRRNHFSKTL